jgi:hypothetical protein
MSTVNIEETFALIVRRIVEARRLAATGCFSAEGGLDEGVESGERQTQTTGLGTRRAVTVPYSPLPGDPERASTVGLRQRRVRGGRRCGGSLFVGDDTLLPFSLLFFLFSDCILMGWDVL